MPFLINNKITAYFKNKDIESFKSLPNAPYLISFPRTGSHWLRMLLELYSDQPLLVRSFYSHSNKNYLLLHTHDSKLIEERNNVIYLYRHPTDVVYSQICYYKQDVNNKNLIFFWSFQYAAHLSHWIFLENSTKKKTIITYEKLQNKPHIEFQKICHHLNLDWMPKKFDEIFKSLNKTVVSNNSKHDKMVINTTYEYQKNKVLFIKNYNSLILDQFAQFSDSVFSDKSILLNLFTTN